MRLALAAPCAARRHAPTPAVVALGWIMGCSACAFVCGGAGAGAGLGGRSGGCKVGGGANDERSRHSGVVGSRHG